VACSIRGAFAAREAHVALTNVKHTGLCPRALDAHLASWCSQPATVQRYCQYRDYRMWLAVCTAEASVLAACSWNWKDWNTLMIIPNMHELLAHWCTVHAP
jgi:hypothetical protein